MKKHRSGTIILICVFAILGCGVAKTDTNRKEADGTLITPRNLREIGGREWRLTRMVKDNQPIPLVENSSVTFACNEVGKVTGLATINRYFGTLKFSANGSLEGNQAFGMTRMAGPPDLMKQEDRFLNAMSEISWIYRNGSVLIMKSKDRSTLLEFE